MYNGSLVALFSRMRPVTIIVFFMLALATGGLMFAPGMAKWAAVVFGAAAVLLAYVIWGPRGRELRAAHTVPESRYRTSQQPGEETE